MNPRTLLLASLLGALAFAGPASAEIDFNKDIKPILEQRCVKCHGPDKPKGGLRLDTREGWIKGTKSGKIVEPGKADKSDVMGNLTAEKDDPTRMPNEGDPLTKEQIAKIRDWINEGLKWPEGLVLKAAGDTGKPVTAPEDAGLPISAAEKAAVEKVQKAGVFAMRLAQNTNLLRVDFSQHKEAAKDEVLALLKDMPNLTELGLGNTAVTDASLAHLKACTNLSRLQLQNTKITDAGLENLKGMQKLVSLNLYGTAVTDKGLEHLKGLKKLRSLYLWQSKATKEGALELCKAIEGLIANLGPDGDITYPPRPVPKYEEPKKEEPKKDDPKKDPPKKDPPKKDPPKKDPPKKDPPKKDEPKKDPPKKDEPKKDPPKKDEPKKDGDQ
jgi:mono/diheme cytochrome c family protein